MSVVLLEQLLEEFNKEETQINLDVYNVVLPNGSIEVGIVDTISDTSILKITGYQTKETSYQDVLEQGTSKMIDHIFKQGISMINKQNNETH